MIDQERLQALWEDEPRGTLYGAISPLVRGLGDVSDPHRERIGDKLELIVGDLAISKLEEELAGSWACCLDRQERAFRVTTAFHRCIQAAAGSAGAEIVLIDLGPNLDAINRAALVASQHIVVPVAPDLVALQGIRNLGPTVMQWHGEWKQRLRRNPVETLTLTEHVIRPAGYVVLKHAVRLDRPMQAYERCMDRIPEAYASSVLGEPALAEHPSTDPRCLGVLKQYWSLMSMAQEARKPIFHLRPADGALGAYAVVTREARADFKRLAERIAQATWQKPARPDA